MLEYQLLCHHLENEMRPRSVYALFVFVLLMPCCLLTSSVAAETTACSPTFDCFGFDDDPASPRLCGTDLDDPVLEGTDQPDRLCGLAGQDNLLGNQGDDMLNGNQGDDLVRGGMGNDLIRGGQGDDELLGDLGNDHLWGDLGRDVLDGGEGDDTYHYRRGDGHDTITDTVGNDRLVIYDLSSTVNTIMFNTPVSCEIIFFTPQGGSIFVERSCLLLEILFADEDCLPQDTTLCLQDNRFQIDVEFTDTDGETEQAQVVKGVESEDSGLFWFFAPDNWEMLVKVIDGCSVNDHFWVFAAATTNVEFTLTVTDRQTGESFQRTNPSGTLAVPVGDIEALNTCP